MVTGGGGRLREKFENLYKMRAEIEMDIEALKRILDLLGVRLAIEVEFFEFFE
jgi:hypothetical protein